MINETLVRGDSMVIYANSKPIVCCTSVSISITTEYIETSVSGSGGSSTILPTKDNWSTNVDGVVSIDEGNLITFPDLQILQLAKTLITVEVISTAQNGFTYTRNGSGYIVESSDTGSYDGMDTFSLSLRGSGGLSIAQVSHLGRILAETGDYVLAETGDFILTE